MLETRKVDNNKDMQDAFCKPTFFGYVTDMCYLEEYSGSIQCVVVQW